VIDIPCPEAHIVRAACTAGMPGPRETDARDADNSAGGPESGGFTVDYRKTLFYGLCGDCGK
jgi:hypothetical protein